MTVKRKRLKIVRGASVDRPYLDIAEPGLDTDREVAVLGNGQADPLDFIMQKALQLVHPKVYSHHFAQVSGSGLAITATIPWVEHPAPTQYLQGMAITFIAAATNTTGNVTLDVNGLGPRAVVRGSGQPLIDQEIYAGYLYTVIYDGARFRIFALSAIAPQSIETFMIRDGAITTVKIADGAVTTIKIANGAVTTEKLADKSVTRAKIADNAIGTDQIEDGSITCADINQDCIDSIIADAVDAALAALPIATTTTVGVIKVGEGLEVTADGTLSVAEGPEPEPSGLKVQKDGADVVAAATTMNFTGAGVTVSGSGANATVNIPGGGGGGGDLPAIADRSVVIGTGTSIRAAKDGAANANWSASGRLGVANGSLGASGGSDGSCLFGGTLSDGSQAINFNDCLGLSISQPPVGGKNWIQCSTNVGTLQFRVGLDGAVAGASFTSPAADYAEWFEAIESLPVGSCVVIGEDGFVRVYDSGYDELEDIVGVVRPRKTRDCLIGNAAEHNWAGMYLKDDYGDPVYEQWTDPSDGTEYTILKVNPTYDPARPYVPRSERPEWNLIGLVGQIPVTAGQSLPPRWKFLKKISDKANLVYVRS
jgi:hypothetical protein